MGKNVITLTNTWAEFKGENIWQAREVLQYQKKGYKFTTAYRIGGWDGMIKLMNQKGRFAAGLVPWLVDRLGQEAISVGIDDQRPPPLPQAPQIAALTGAIELRPHQAEATKVSVATERGVIHHPTAAGKTEVLIEITRRIACPALVLVHRKDLMYQTAARFLETLNTDKEVVGIIGDGNWEPRAITVATFQTLYRRLKDKTPEVLRWLREDIGQVHVDEAHHLPAKSYEKVMAQLWQARYRYGYSATPYKEGDPETFFKVASWLGPTIHLVTASELAEQGHLVPADVFLIRMPAPPHSYKKWQEAVQHGIVENFLRNKRIVELSQHLVAKKRGPVVIMVERLAHGEHLARELGTNFIAGNAPTSTRQAAWEGLRGGTLNVMVTSKIADEGLDIPPLAFLILAGGGKAPHLTLQRVGRGMRTSEGKERLFVFDFLDGGKYLSKHAKQRAATYADQAAYTTTEVDFEEVV